MERVGPLFLGVRLPAEAKAALAAVVRGWNEGRPLPGRPVLPESWHLTLRFLGQTEETAAERVLAGLDQADLGDAFSVELDGIGAFPNPRRATVLWVGISRGEERLADLAAAAEEAAQHAGFEPEERPFRPHLTLSRLRPDQDVRSLLARPPPAPVRFTVAAVTLFRSHLGGGPARYEPLEEVDLGGSRT